MVAFDVKITKKSKNTDMTLKLIGQDKIYSEYVKICHGVCNALPSFVLQCSLSVFILSTMVV